MKLRLQGLAPVIAPHTRLLVLGSFPSVASLNAQQYYAHPRNQFWPMLSALWNTDLVALNYQARLSLVTERGLGIWDVYARCERQGSLDSAIKSAELNDFSALRVQAPDLQAVAHNGGESARGMRHTGGQAHSLGWAVYRLPSTSPANASWSFQRKLDAWRTVFSAHGLT